MKITKEMEKRNSYERAGCTVLISTNQQADDNC